MHRAYLFALAIGIAMPGQIAAQPVMPASQGETSIQAAVAAAQGKLREAILSNDAANICELYLPDAISLPEYQPALFGQVQILAYQQALQARRRILNYVPTTSEVFEFGDSALEFGTFVVAWRANDGAPEELRGKYANLWAKQADGTLRLKADVTGFFEPLPDEARHFVALPAVPPPQWLRESGNQELAQVLDRLNQENAAAVHSRDLEERLRPLAEDAILLPFADTPKRGMAEIRPYMAAYIAGGEKVEFDDVRVWNIGFLDHGHHVIEFSNFQVAWRFSGDSGVTKGGGLRLWTRHADGTLKRYREIGTHDHIP